MSVINTNIKSLIVQNAIKVNNRLMVYPAPIFLFVALIYLVLCTSLDGAARWLSDRFVIIGSSKRIIEGDRIGWVSQGGGYSKMKFGEGWLNDLCAQYVEATVRRWQVRMDAEFNADPANDVSVGPNSLREFMLGEVRSGR